MSSKSPGKQPASYMSPYLAGVGIGLVMLAAFVLVGRGLGASGAFSSVVATTVRAAAPAHGAGNTFYDAYAQPLLSDWLVLEVIGITLGAFASAWLARRLSWRIERGAGSAASTRLWFAFAGGATMGLGAKLARGCTSGLGLTGGALLSVGSWLFIIAAFASAYALAPLIRKAWQ